jgi:hypothetical protein
MLVSLAPASSNLAYVDVSIFCILLPTLLSCTFMGSSFARIRAFSSCILQILSSQLHIVRIDATFTRVMRRQQRGVLPVLVSLDRDCDSFVSCIAYWVHPTVTLLSTDYQPQTPRLRQGLSSIRRETPGRTRLTLYNRAGSDYTSNDHQLET